MNDEARSLEWYYCLDGEFYAAGPLKFEKPVCELHARFELKKIVGTKAGNKAELWPTSSESREQILTQARKQRAEFARYGVPLCTTD